MPKTIACRCEDVTLNELEEALARGFRDLESVKRYTGFGTGICQGRHCQSACVAWLEQHGGIAVPKPFTARPPLVPTPLSALAPLMQVLDKKRREDA